MAASNQLHKTQRNVTDPTNTPTPRPSESNPTNTPTPRPSDDPTEAQTPRPKAGQPTLFLLFVGVGMLSLFTVVLVTQVQTNEAFFLHTGQVNLFQPDWTILWQIPVLVMGDGGSTNQAMATIVGWGIELVYLGCIAGYELMKHSVHQASGHTMVKLFRTLCWVMIGFNGYTDYQYGTIGSGVIGHLLFAAACSLIVGYFGTIGLFLVKHAWNKA